VSTIEHEDYWDKRTQLNVFVLFCIYLLHSDDRGSIPGGG